jgi:signal peptidase I
MSEEPIPASSPMPPIPTLTAPSPSTGEPREQPAAPPAPGNNAHIETKDSLREIVETIVFVIVLVLLLKSFVAEAFVIPTGSMAETLWGYQKEVECPQCHFKFPVNCSSEVEPPQSLRQPVRKCVCPNCRYEIDFAEDRITAGPQTGDRVLVDKTLYDLLQEPARFDVVVFKYPGKDDRDGPQKEHVPMNYIKRLIGKPGETIAIYRGDLYRTTDLGYPNHTRPTNPDELRRDVLENDESAKTLFEHQLLTQFRDEGKGFQIIRKDPDKILALMRIVYDNDHQAADLRTLPPRWSGEGSWVPDSTAQPKRFSHAGSSLEWLTYRHRLRKSQQPQLITDFSGYNNGDGKGSPPRENWVGDLILECEVSVEKPEGMVVMDLAKGTDRFQARWDLATGTCSLIRIADTETVLDSRPTDMKKSGTYSVRFANVDERLTVWLNDRLIFAEGVTYKPPKERGPEENDLKPARIGVQGGAVVDHIKLHRDTYYTTAIHGDPAAADANTGDWSSNSSSWSNPEEWEPLRHNLPWKTLYVQPGHYLCMGDNSPESSDGRYWGLVPRRLMLGRALLVYYPVGRAGRIR